MQPYEAVVARSCCALLGVSQNRLVTGCPKPLFPHVCAHSYARAVNKSGPRALTGARADMCTSNGSPEIGH
eukprot:3476741-Lingulodinium_polyedra.AAC.1